MAALAVAAIAWVVAGPLMIGAAFIARRHCSSLFLAGWLAEPERIPAMAWLPLRVTQRYGATIIDVSLAGWVLASAKFDGPPGGCTLFESLSEPCDLFDADYVRPQPLPVRRNARLEAVLAAELNRTLPNGEPGNVRGLVVLHRGALVAEQYRAPFTADSRQHGWSMTKSWLMSLVGLRVGEGRMSTTDPVVFRNGSVSPNIVIAHLLNMTSGLQWEEQYGPTGDPTRMLFSRSGALDVVAFVENGRGVEHPPGSYWRYSSGDTNLLYNQLERTFPSSCECRRWVQRALRTRLGLASALVESDARGNLIFSSFGWATPRDWARWGEGARLREFDLRMSQLVECSLTTGKRRPYAGHVWKRLDRPRDAWFSAEGFEYQFVVVVPDRELVVAQLACTRGDRVIDVKDQDQARLVDGIIAALEE